MAWVGIWNSLSRKESPGEEHITRFITEVVGATEI